MAFTDEAALATDVTFRQRVTIATVVAAKAVMAEGFAGPGHENYHILRQQLAQGVLNTPAAYTDRFALAVASNPAVNANSVDSDIQFTVDQTWSLMAGVPSWQVPTS
jgi:hypothetical protein